MMNLFGREIRRRVGVCALVGGLLVSHASASEFRFDLRWDTVAPPLIEAAMALPPITSQADLRVIPDGDRLVFENGETARFWGIGLTFSGGKSTKFPPPRHLAARLIRKLKSFGFNHVRFVGFDNMAPEPFLSWVETGRLDSETMDRFDYFVAELKKAGFYYSISINNSARLPLGLGRAIEPNGSAQTKLRAYKYVRLFHEPAVGRMVEWFVAFFSHVNRYTGLSYAADPANLYVSAANEGSLFEPFFSDFKTLDSKYRAELSEYFQVYLTRRYGSIEAATNAWRKDGGDRCYRKPGEGGPSPELLGASELVATCTGRIADTVAFLIDMDSSAARRIRSALRGLGYRGLFSVTNNWYGYGALEANIRNGDYIDLHGYFWHPRRSPASPTFESVPNSSWVANSRPLSDLDAEFSYPLSKAFRAATPMRPLVFSEWGIGAWNAYQYEAPLIMMAYAAFQGYPALAAHTYFNHPDPDPEDTVSRHALTVSGNASLMAMMPSLSLAFRRGDISSPATSRLYRCAPSQDSFLRQVVRYRLKRVGKQCGFYASEGYVNKLRLLPYSSDGAGSKSIVGRDYGEADVLRTSTGQITWRRRPLSAASFVVDTERFKGVAVPQDRRTITLGQLDLRFRSRGAMTMVSLDGAALERSRSILITTVRGFRNDGTVDRENRHWRTIVDPGQAPVMLATADVEVTWRGRARSMQSLVLCAMHSGGLMTLIKRFEQPRTSSSDVAFAIGKASTPWYWLGEPGDRGTCVSGPADTA